MSACMIVATDEKGRPLGEVLAVATFVEKGMRLKLRQPLAFEMHGELHHLEVRCVGDGRTPGPIVWTMDMPTIVRVGPGIAMPVAELEVGILVEGEFQYV